MKNKILLIIIAITLLCFPKENFGQAPTLGTAANFALFTSIGAVTNSGTPYLTHITGNVGTNSDPTSPGFGNVDGAMTFVSDPRSALGASDLLIAYNQLNSRIATFFPAPGLGSGPGQIILPGVDSISGAATLNLNLILDGQGDSNAVFIFKIEGPFSTAANSKVKLINGAKACNVFWKIEGLVDMATGTMMKGTVIANNAAINMAANDTLEGRALSTNGAITTNEVLIYTPIGCSSPYLTGPAAPTLSSAACYGLFSSIGPVTNAGITFAVGDVGTNSGLTTGFDTLNVTGKVHPIPDTSTAACSTDLQIVYNYLNTPAYDIELLHPEMFGHSLVLTPHTYMMNGAVTSMIDTVFLNGEGNPNAVFIIKEYGAFSTAVNSYIKLINGTQAKNVFWLITGAASIGDFSVFNGTIISGGAIDLLTGTIINGRALTITGALNTYAINATIPPGTCGAISSPVIFIQPSPLTICAGDTARFSVSAMGSGLTYQWMKGNTPLVNGGNISGADSAILYIYPTSVSDTFSFYNVIVSGTSLPNDTSINVSLLVNPVYTTNNPQTICPGNAYVFNGNTYTVAGNYSDTLSTINGCDSIIVTQLSVNPVYTTNNPQTICPGNAYVFNGNTYTVAGNYSDTISTMNGCDSIIVTQLSVNPVYTTNNPQTICPGNAYVFNGNTYTVAGNYNDTLSTMNGCDSIIVTQLFVNPVYTTNNPQTVCAGNSYIFNGNTYWVAGNYSDTLSTMNGCDSIIVTQLSVNPVYSTNNPQTICAGSSYVFSGHTYTVAGNFSDTLSTINGCDSIIVTQLFVNPVYSINNPQTICAGSSYVFNGNTYTVAGNYNDILSTVNGCDSIIVTQLSVNPVYSTNNPQTICAGSSYAFNGNTYTVAGNYNDILSTVNGCDSIIVTQLSVNQIPVAIANANTPVCTGSAINLTAQTVTGGTYSWTGPNGYSSSAQDTVILSSTIADAGTYSLTVSANGCTSSPSIVSIVVHNCIADLSIVKTVDDTHPFIGHNVVFTIIATNNGPYDATAAEVTDILQSGYTYVSSTTTIGTFNPSTGVWVIGTLINGASAALTITATVNAEGNYVNTAIIYGNEMDSLMANNVSSVEPQPTDFFIPQGFSPNADGINDVFVIRGILNYPENSIVIFNRWGNKVFEANPYQNTWDGKSQTGLRVGGDNLPIGTYFYILDLHNDTPIFKGTIYLNK